MNEIKDGAVFPLYGDWLLVHGKQSGMDLSSIMDSDGNTIYDTYRLMSVDDAASFCKGFEHGVARGKAQGELETKTAMRKALGL